MCIICIKCGKFVAKRNCPILVMFTLWLICHLEEKCRPWGPEAAYGTLIYHRLHLIPLLSNPMRDVNNCS